MTFKSQGKISTSRAHHQVFLHKKTFLTSGDRFLHLFGECSLPGGSFSYLLVVSITYCLWSYWPCNIHDDCITRSTMEVISFISEHYHLRELTSLYHSSRQQILSHLMTYLNSIMVWWLSYHLINVCTHFLINAHHLAFIPSSYNLYS